MRSSGSCREQCVIPFPFYNTGIPILSFPVPIPLTAQNLDVNQAVNNLLSRDDDDGGEAESSDGDPLIPAALFPSGGTSPNCDH